VEVRTELGDRGRGSYWRGPKQKKGKKGTRSAGEGVVGSTKLEAEPLLRAEIVKMEGREGGRRRSGEGGGEASPPRKEKKGGEKDEGGEGRWG